MSALHREFPEASEDEIRMKAAALSGRAGSARPFVERECRDCRTTYRLSAELAARPRTKWTSLCPSCLSDHL
jgi:hypothetical protein